MLDEKEDLAWTVQEQKRDTVHADTSAALFPASTSVCHIRLGNNMF